MKTRIVVAALLAALAFSPLAHAQPVRQCVEDAVPGVRGFVCVMGGGQSVGQGDCEGAKDHYRSNSVGAQASTGGSWKTVWVEAGCGATKTPAYWGEYRSVFVHVWSGSSEGSEFYEVMWYESEEHTPTSEYRTCMAYAALNGQLVPLPCPRGPPSDELPILA